MRDGGRQDVGWLALAVHGVGLYALGRWTPRFQYVAALAPALSLATLGLVVGRQCRRGGLDTTRFAWLAIISAASMRSAPSR